MVTYPSEEPAAINFEVTATASMAFWWNFNAPNGFKLAGLSQEKSLNVESQDPPARIFPSFLILRLEIDPFSPSKWRRFLDFVACACAVEERSGGNQ